MIARAAREIAEHPGRWGSAVAAGKRKFSAGTMAATMVTAAGTPTLASVVAPDVSLVAGLAVVGVAAWSLGPPALGAALDALVARRPPERNAITYLLNARPR